MTQLLNVFYSNRVEILFENLKTTLFDTTASPFTNRIIVVPSPAMKSWLMLRLASDPTLNVAAGIQICHLEQGLNKIIDNITSKNNSSYDPNILELALKIEVEIRHAIDNSSFLPPKEKEVWAPLFNYLKIGSSQHLSRKSERRLIALTEKLAHLFKQYGKYGAEMLSDWETKGLFDWQQALWKALFCAPLSTWTYPYRSLNSAALEEPKRETHVHLFAISFISHLQHQFLSKASEFLPISYYLLSPCQAFWSDIQSDRECSWIQNLWKERKVSDGQLNDLEELLQDRNPLLANFGRLGREMAKELEEANTETAEDYVITDKVVGIDNYSDLLYDDLLLEKHAEGLTLLHALQSDLVLLRNPDSSEKICVDTDDSIQVHVSTSKMREIENLQDTLLKILDKHKDSGAPITPNDIVVMAPDIMEYAPYIKAVFERGESLLDCQIMDLTIPAQSQLIQSFLSLLSLPEGRWDVSSILQLFESPLFQKRHHISLEEIQTIRTWIKDSSIHWGQNSEHRNELLKRDHCENEMEGDSKKGTWHDGLNRLISSLCSKEENDRSTDFSFLNRLNVDSSQAEILGKWMSIIRSLRQDLEPLVNGSKLTVSEWATYMECLLEGYFAIDNRDSEQEEDREMLLHQIEELRHASTVISTYKFSFITIKKHLTSALNRKHTCYRESALQTVRFCSMLPMRALPAKVIVLIGMNEGAYPKQDITNSLNMLHKYQNADYCPSQTDYDRFLFLEIILSARKYLLISYSGSSPDGKSEAHPSLLVTELMAYLDRSYVVSNEKPSINCFFKHPYDSFDEEYFSENSTIRSYSPSRYQAAKAFYLGEKIEDHSFIKDFSIDDNKDSSSDEQGDTLELRHLKSFARNPLQSYFNKTLGIYIDQDGDLQPKDDEDFVLSALDNAIIRKAALKIPFGHLVEALETNGKLPIGLFKEAAVQKLHIEVNQLKGNLKKAQINPNELFEIEFSRQNEVCDVSDPFLWKLPAIKIQHNEKPLYIVGKLSDVSAEGLIGHFKDSREDLSKAWPEYLCFCSLIDTHNLPIKKQLFFAKASKACIKPSLNENSEELLKDYIDYYLLSRKNISPLIPEWIPKILSSEPKEFKKIIEKAFNDPFNPLYNDYLEWSLSASNLPCTETLINTWKGHADKLFSTPYSQWFPSKTKVDKGDEK